MFGKKQSLIAKIWGKKTGDRDIRLWLALLAIIFLLIFLINCAYKSRLKSAYISDLELQIRYLQQYNERIKEQVEGMFSL